MPTCKKCNYKFPNRLNVDGKIRNISKRKYCFKCSPFGRHNTRQLNNTEVASIGKKYCPYCKQIKLLKFFCKGGCGYCKRCFNRYNVIRQRKVKQNCIDYKGGKCQLCGYSKCNSALEFHHRNSLKKDFQISKNKSATFSEVMKKELDKCDLLCSNCHREIHERILNVAI